MFSPNKGFVTDKKPRKWPAHSSTRFAARRETLKILGKAPPKKVYTVDRRDSMLEYNHIKKIGEGGQGRCDLMKRRGDGNCFVYKQMKSDMEFTRSKGEKKPLEAAILKDILAPSDRVIKLFDYNYASPTKNFFFFEYCAFGDLFNMIDGYHNDVGLQIPESFVWHTYLQLADALTFIQEGITRKTTPEGKRIGWTTPSYDHRPIVHRDIKPDNIFLRPGKTNNHYPEIVLADFGLATTELRSCTEEDDFLGTMPYQGPEIPLHSLAGDHWAIGACIHHMTTGGPPIKKVPEGRSRQWWSFKPEARKVKDVTKSGYSRMLDDAMFKTLRSNPKDRLQGSALVGYLERAINKWNGDRILLKPWWEYATK